MEDTEGELVGIAVEDPALGPTGRTEGFVVGAEDGIESGSGTPVLALNDGSRVGVRVALGVREGVSVTLCTSGWDDGLAVGGTVTGLEVGVVDGAGVGTGVGVKVGDVVVVRS